MGDPKQPTQASGVREVAGLALARHPHLTRISKQPGRGHVPQPAFGTLCRRNSDRVSSSNPQAPQEVLNCTDELLHAVAAQLTDLVGAEGYHALLVRALNLASTEFPLLSEVQVAHSPTAHLALSRFSRLRSSDSSQLQEASAAVLSQFLRLVEEFLGPELVRSVIRESWPSLPTA